MVKINISKEMSKGLKEIGKNIDKEEKTKLEELEEQLLNAKIKKNKEKLQREHKKIDEEKTTNIPTETPIKDTKLIAESNEGKTYIEETPNKTTYEDDFLGLEEQEHDNNDDIYNNDDTIDNDIDIPNTDISDSISDSVNVVDNNKNNFDIKEISKLIEDKLLPMKNTLIDLMTGIRENTEMFERTRNFMELEKVKHEKVVEGFKKYQGVIRDTIDKEKEIKIKKEINLSDFTMDEIIAIRNILERKVAEYQHDLRNINLTSDITIDKLKIYRMAYRMLTYILNVISPDEITYKKIDKLLNSTDSYNDKLIMYYDLYMNDEYKKDIVQLEAGKVIHENEKSVNKLIDIFLSILDKQDTIIFDDIIGIKIKSKEALDLIDFINEK